MRRPYTVTVFGAGGIGGFLAGKIGTYIRDTGDNVYSLALVARGAHRDAVIKKGLTLISADSSEGIVFPSVCTDNPGNLPETDLFLMCVKGYDLTEAARAIAPLVRENTVVLPLLNGADIHRRMRQEIDTGIILPGCIYISSAITEPATVRHFGGAGEVIVGRDPENPSFFPSECISLFTKAGIPLTWQDNPFQAIWTKFMFISSFSLVTAVTRKCFGEVLSDPELTGDVRSIMEEVRHIARAEGTEIDADAPDRGIVHAHGFPPETRTSFQRDVEAGKTKDERDILGHTIIRLGSKYGIPVPAAEHYVSRLPS